MARAAVLGRLSWREATARTVVEPVTEAEHAQARALLGRIDAVFTDGDGGAVVLDWKTGEPPSTPEAQRHAAIQLAVYRLAWAGLRGCPVESVRAAFHYVRSGVTVMPDSLPDAEELAALLEEG